MLAGPRGDRPQIVIGLLCTADGIPIAHHVFAGNTGDASTLPGVLADLAARFAVGRICVVADRGLISSDNVETGQRDGRRPDKRQPDKRRPKNSGSPKKRQPDKRRPDHPTPRRPRRAVAADQGPAQCRRHRVPLVRYSSAAVNTGCVVQWPPAGALRTTAPLIVRTVPNRSSGIFRA